MRPLSSKFTLALAAFILLATGVCRAQAQAQAQSRAQAPAQAQDGWPKSIITSGGTIINVYQPQVLSYSGDIVKSRSVISVKNEDDDYVDPVFGTAWITARVMRDSAGRDLQIQSVNVDQLRMPDDTERADNDFISAALEVYFPWVVKSLPETAVRSSLLLGQEEASLAQDTGVAGPKVYFATVPTALVLIDGEPRLERNERWGVDVVANSRNVIVKGKDGAYHLYYAMRWYEAPDATGPYTGGTFFPAAKELRKIQRDLLKAARKADAPLEQTDAGMRRIVVSTVPAVLVQTLGEPKFEGVGGTSLTSVENTNDVIYYDKSSSIYFARAAGSWYRTSSLASGDGWRPVRKVDLPVDILLNSGGATSAGAVAGSVARTAAGSETVVAGTGSGASMAGVGSGTAASGADARRAGVEATARMDEYVPQTSRVDRRTTTTVDYDGAPRFRPIPGTELEYATNTCSIVFQYNGAYYALDNGVWFTAGSPMGAWQVSDTRPEYLELIPRRYRVYRAKFVYVYLTEPDYVIEGYLPGYSDQPADDCALAASYDNNWNDMSWGFDLGCIFGWDAGGYFGYYRFDRLNRYYGHLVYEGSRPGWHEKRYGPWSKNHGGGGNGGGRGGNGGGANGGGTNGGGTGGGTGSGGGTNGGIRSGWVINHGQLPHPPGGWGGRTYAGGSESGNPRGIVSPGGSVSGGGSRGYAGGGVSRGYSGGTVSRPGGGFSGGGGSRGYSGGGGRVSTGGGGGGHVSTGGGGGGGGHVSSGGGGSTGGGGGGGGHSGGGSSGGGGGASGHH